VPNGQQIFAASALNLVQPGLQLPLANHEVERDDRESRLLGGQLGMTQRDVNGRQ
jgi:hypothetical protein